MRRLAAHAGSAAILAGLVVLWQVWVESGAVARYIVPAPSDVGRALWDGRAALRHDVWVTFEEMVAGFAAGVAAGLVAAVALHASPLLRRAAYPLLVASQSVPVPALAPLLVLGLGYGLAPKVVVVALLCFFPVTVNALDGFAAVDPEWIETMRTLRASRTAVFRRVEFPGALPAIFSGARVGAAYAAIAAVFAEAVGAFSGLGVVLRQANGTFDTALVGAAIVLVAALSLGLFGLVALAERLLVPWARRPPRAR